MRCRFGLNWTAQNKIKMKHSKSVLSVSPPDSSKERKFFILLFDPKDETKIIAEIEKDTPVAVDDYLRQEEHYTEKERRRFWQNLVRSALGGSVIARSLMKEVEALGLAGK